MPITPFHGGVGLICKGPLAERFSFTIFVATQIAIDFESGYFLVTRQYPVHRFFHTFVGATVVCLAVAVVLRRPLERALRFAHAAGVASRWIRTSHAIPLRVALPSALVGVLGHVVPDAIMHADSRPFAPFTDANPFLGALSLGTLHLSLVLAGGLGLGWIALGRKA